MKKLICALAAILALSANAELASAQADRSVSCTDAFTTVETARPIMRVVSHMMEWCVQNDPTQPACIELSKAANENEVVNNSKAFTGMMFVIGLRCPEGE